MAFAAALALGAGCGSDAQTRSTGTTGSTVATSATIVTSTAAPSTTGSTVGSTVGSTTVPTTVTLPTGGETTVADTGSIDSSVQVLVEIATADLVARLGISASAVSVLTAKPMTWPDKSLGCPKPGMQYVQVQVDGALIELQAGGRTYSYHSGNDGQPTLCEQGFSGFSGQAIPPATT